MTQNEKRPIEHFSINVPVIPPVKTCGNCGDNSCPRWGLEGTCLEWVDTHEIAKPFPQPEPTERIELSPEDNEWMNAAMGPQVEAKPVTEVCVWTKRIDRFESQCQRIYYPHPVYIQTFPFCPYCSKKIKIEEVKSE